MNKTVTAILSVIIIALGGCSIQMTGTSDTVPSSESQNSSVDTSVSSESDESSEDTTVSSSDTSEDTTATSEEEMNYDAQIRYFLDRPSVWRSKIPPQHVSDNNEVMFTDLDGDGYVEMFVARLGRNEIDTTFELYEYDLDSPDGYRFLIDYTEDVDTADIIADRMDAYYNDSVVFYSARDTARGYGLVEYNNKYFMIFEHDHIRFELLASARTTTDEGGEFTDYFDGQELPMPESEFNTIFDTSASSRGNLTKTSVNLSWFPAEDIESADAGQLAQTVAVRPR